MIRGTQTLMILMDDVPEVGYPVVARQRLNSALAAPRIAGFSPRTSHGTEVQGGGFTSGGIVSLISRGPVVAEAWGFSDSTSRTEVMPRGPRAPSGSL